MELRNLAAPTFVPHSLRKRKLFRAVMLIPFPTHAIPVLTFPSERDERMGVIYVFLSRSKFSNLPPQLITFPARPDIFVGKSRRIEEEARTLLNRTLPSRKLLCRKELKRAVQNQESDQPESDKSHSGQSKSAKTKSGIY